MRCGIWIASSDSRRPAERQGSRPDIKRRLGHRSTPSRLVTQGTDAQLAKRNTERPSNRGLVMMKVVAICVLASTFFAASPANAVKIGYPEAAPVPCPAGQVKRGDRCVVVGQCRPGNVYSTRNGGSCVAHARCPQGQVFNIQLDKCAAPGTPTYYKSGKYGMSPQTCPPKQVMGGNGLCRDAR